MEIIQLIGGELFMESKFKVGDAIYLLQFETNKDGTINRILSTTYTVVSTGADRVLVETCNKREREYVSIFHIENQTLLWGEQTDAEAEVLSRYMWTTDINSSMKKMIEESIDICSDMIKRFSEMSNQLFTIYKNNIGKVIEVK